VGGALEVNGAAVVATGAAVVAVVVVTVLVPQALISKIIANKMINRTRNFFIVNLLQTIDIVNIARVNS